MSRSLKHPAWRPAGVLGVAGAVVGAVVTVVGYLIGSSNTRADFGWSSYSPSPRRYADYLPATDTGTHWAAALATATAVGLGTGLVLAAVLALIGRHVVLARSSAAATAQHG